MLVTKGSGAQRGQGLGQAILAGLEFRDGGGPLPGVAGQNGLTHGTRDPGEVDLGILGGDDAEQFMLVDPLDTVAQVPLAEHPLDPQRHGDQQQRQKTRHQLGLEGARLKRGHPAINEVLHNWGVAASLRTPMRGTGRGPRVPSPTVIGADA